jgi:hypothetical protein
MFNQNYQQLLRRINPQQQQQLPQNRPLGFGGHFKDKPPPFITETKKDNKIERIKKPKKKKKPKLKIKYQDKV